MRFPKSLSSIGLLALAAGRNVLAATGGEYCGRLVCVGARISGSETIYTLNTTASFSDFGWMAVGFGSSMAGSPMVIMWANNDGSIVLSQRQATGHVQPQVVSNPARVAAIRSDLSSLTGSAITLSFSVPSSGQTSEDMIYAFGRVKPNSNDVAANLAQHAVNGVFTLDLTQTVSDAPSTTVATGTATASATLAVPTQTGSSGNSPLNIPYTSAEKKLLAHGILSALGFCFFLPVGVLQARFLRIWWPKWFKTHWIVQAGLAGPFIVVGFALAVSAVADSGGSHFADKHMVIGLVLFLLYVCQALYGLIIHIVKDPYRRRRPIQNYGHAILGVALIALSLYQTWLGFNYEWPRATGRDKPSDGVRIFWIVWVAILGVAYVIGLALVPKQYKAERYAVQDGGKRHPSDDDVHAMAARRT